MWIRSGVEQAANGVLAALLAPECGACGALLTEPLKGCVCAFCWSAIPAITPPVCDRCGEPLAYAERPCGCRMRRRVVARARAAGEYEGSLRQIVHALKYSRRQSLAVRLSERMRVAGSALIEAADCVVPVPLHWRREYRRGFNQARELARHLPLPIVEALQRIRDTRPQVELAAAERARNIDGAFALRPSSLLAGRSVEHFRVLLIDDVTTTGATLDECARVLTRGGAAAVYALTAARVSRGRASLDD